MSVRANHSYAETVARYQATVCRCGKAKKARHSFCFALLFCAAGSDAPAALWNFRRGIRTRVPAGL